MSREPSSRRPDRNSRKPAKPARDGDVVRLEDLEPRKEVRGGSRTRLFGEAPSGTPDRRRGGS